VPQACPESVPCQQGDPPRCPRLLQRPQAHRSESAGQLEQGPEHSSCGLTYTCRRTCGTGCWRWACDVGSWSRAAPRGRAPRGRARRGRRNHHQQPKPARRGGAAPPRQGPPPQRGPAGRPGPAALLAAPVVVQRHQQPQGHQPGQALRRQRRTGCAPAAAGQILQRQRQARRRRGAACSQPAPAYAKPAAAHIVAAAVAAGHRLRPRRRLTSCDSAATPPS
jgi:hypothetical protein